MATSVNIPPKPTRSPDVHLNGIKPQKPTRTLKDDLGKLKTTAASFRSSWTEGRGVAKSKESAVRKEAGEILAPVKEKVSEKIGEEKRLADQVMQPVFRVIGSIKRGVDPANSRTRPYVTSFMASTVLSWAFGPQLLVAVYERIRFGTSTTDWGLLQGPGRWFRDTVGMARETGQTPGLILAIFLGLSPMILLGVRNLTASHIARSSYRGRLASFGIKWVARAPYLVPAAYLVGVGYPEYVTPLFGSPWTLQWWQVYLAGLFCTAYYFTMWAFDRIEENNVRLAGMSDEERAKEKAMGPGLFHAVLMIPLASIITGVLLDAPGAAW